MNLIKKVMSVFGFSSDESTEVDEKVQRKIPKTFTNDEIDVLRHAEALVLQASPENPLDWQTKDPQKIARILINASDIDEAHAEGKFFREGRLLERESWCKALAKRMEELSRENQYPDFDWTCLIQKPIIVAKLLREECFKKFDRKYT